MSYLHQLKPNVSILRQPVGLELRTPEGKQVGGISLEHFLRLLECEERCWVGQECDTKSLITRLRKIFYDTEGWDRHLIPGAAATPGRYVWGAAGAHKTQDINSPKHTGCVKFRSSAAPEIAANGNQHVLLPDGLHCDMGHVLAGVDALNHPVPVTPLPRWLGVLRRLLPHVERNADAVTWFGDLASVSGEFVLQHFRQGADLTAAQRQRLLNGFSSGPDMLGNIDAYLISGIYNTSTRNGFRVSEILADYYFEGGRGNRFCRRRFSYFCHTIGLRGWGKRGFGNELDWLRINRPQLKHATVFYLYASQRGLRPALTLAVNTWLGRYNHLLCTDELLRAFLAALKAGMHREHEACR